MSHRSSPILLAVVVVVLATVMWRYPSLLGGEKTVTAQASVDPSQLTLANTDDNTGEDLIISSDKKIYEGFGGSTVYFSVDPLAKKSEHVGLQFYFTDPHAMVTHLYQYQKSAHYWLEIPLSSGAITGDGYATAMDRRKALEGKAYIQSHAAYDSAGEKQYFMADISYESGTPGEFLIEGFGSTGSYGLLDPWYNSGWAYRKKITINPQYVSGASGQTNFPMLFSRTDTDLIASVNGGHVASTTGGDILFTDADGNKIPHEIEKYASTTGQLVAWVKIPFISSTSTRDMYIYYGNSTVPLANQQDTTNVWDTNYKGVWHLPDGAPPNANDSTSNANHSSGVGSGTFGSGQIGGGVANNSESNTVINIPYTSSLDLSPTSITVSAWVLPTDKIPTNYDAIIGKEVAGGGWPYTLYHLGRAAGSSQVIFQISDNVNYDFVQAGDLPAGQWEYLTGTYDGATIRLYQNGVQLGTTASTKNIGTNTRPLGIGWNTEASGNAFKGTIDEARVSNIARSADWITTEYNNQASPNAFYSYSGEGVNIRANTVAGVKVRTGSPATDWYNTAWGYRKKITVNPQYVGGGESNFPMLFSRIDADLKATASGGNVASTTGGDILFTDAQGNKLAHEIEKYTSTTGELIAWVKVPFVSSTSTRDVYMYYGNATVPLANQQNKTGVWDTNYKGVWHLPDGTTLTANDSTSNANNASGVGSETAATGQIDGGASDNAENHTDIRVPYNSSLDLSGKNITVSAWAKPTDTIPGDFLRLVNKQISGGGDPYELWSLNRQGGSSAMIFHISDGTTGNFQYASGGAMVGGQWAYWTGTYDGTTIRLYQNGVQVGSTASTLNIGTNNVDVGIGYSTEFGTAGFKGTLDEARVSNIARPADWIATEYNNQASPNTFYSYSGQMVGTTSPATPAVKVRGGVKFR
ncbi:MAG: hypothetical protein RLZZ26_145 [Candidatus Parcubacteria bacterium]|jgi:hypothetical protein